MTNRPRVVSNTDLLGRYMSHVGALPIGAAARRARLRGAHGFLALHSDLVTWMRSPIERRLADLRRMPRAQSFVAFAIVSGAVTGDAELVLARRLGGLREAVELLFAGQLATLRSAAGRLGLAQGRTDAVMSELVPLAVAIVGRPPDTFSESDLDALRDTFSELGHRVPNRAKCLRGDLATFTRLLCEAGTLDCPTPSPTPIRPGPLDNVTAPQIRASIAAYLEVRATVLRPATVRNLTNSLATFGEFVSERFPQVTTFADLGRAEVEAYCAFATSRTWRRSWAAERVVGSSSSCQAVTSLRSFLDDISSWGWPEAPTRRLVFSSDIPRPPKLLPRALDPGDDAALMAAVAHLDDRFARVGLTVLRGTGLRIGELLDLELSHLVDYQEHGFWLHVPLGKLNSQRSVPIDGPALTVLRDWLDERAPCQALPAPRDGHLADFVFVEHGRRLGTSRLRKGLRDAVCAAGLTGPDGKPRRVVAHQLRHTYATSLANAGLSLHALMTLLGHRTPEMTLRYATLSSPTMRRAYEEAMGKLRPRIPVAPLSRPAMGDKVEWLASEMLKTRLAHGYCTRELVAEACPYAAVCENCANFVTAPEFAPVLESQLADERQLRDDARSRGWTSEIARHERVIASLEGHLRHLQA